MVNCPHCKNEVKVVRVCLQTYKNARVNEKGEAGEFYESCPEEVDNIECIECDDCGEELNNIEVVG